ncbi:hypothetical protein ACQ143_01055 [Microbacterium sp. MC2]
MGDSVDGDELAALRARAYGRAAQGLTPAEQDRLEELERARRAPGDMPPVAGPATAPADRREDAAGPAPAASEPASGPPEVIRLRPSRAYLVALVTAAAFVPVAAIGGFLAGAWFADLDVGTAGPTLAGQSDAEVDASLERVRAGQAWDERAPALLGGTADALVWWGTVADGAQTCIVLDLTDIGPMPVCGPTSVVRTSGLSGRLTVLPPAAGDGDGSPTATAAPPVTITYAVNPYTGAFDVTTRDEP